MTLTRCATTTFATLAAALAISACSTSVTGKPMADAQAVSDAHASRAASAAPSTINTLTPNAPLPVETDDLPQASGLDDQVRWYVANIDKFWSMYKLDLDNFVKEASSPFTCPGVPGELDDIAANCSSVVYYDDAKLSAMSAGRQYALAEGMAHEVGHSVERMFILASKPDHDHEMAADCYAGMYISAKNVPLDAAVADFKHTGMFEYGGDEAVAEFTYGYHNFDADHMNMPSVQRCAKKELR